MLYLFQGFLYISVILVLNREIAACIRSYILKSLILHLYYQMILFLFPGMIICFWLFEVFWKEETKYLCHPSSWVLGVSRTP